MAVVGSKRLRAGADSPFGSKLPVLCTGLPSEADAIRHTRLNVAPVQLLRQRANGMWGRLKNELVHHQRYETRAQVQREITEYIEIFYNRQRRHSRLGNLSPAAFAQ